MYDVHIDGMREARVKDVQGFESNTFPFHALLKIYSKHTGKRLDLNMPVNDLTKHSLFVERIKHLGGTDGVQNYVRSAFSSHS